MGQGHCNQHCVKPGSMKDAQMHLPAVHNPCGDTNHQQGFHTSTQHGPIPTECAVPAAMLSAPRLSWAGGSLPPENAASGLPSLDLASPLCTSGLLPCKSSVQANSNNTNYNDNHRNTWQSSTATTMIIIPPHGKVAMPASKRAPLSREGERCNMAPPRRRQIKTLVWHPRGVPSCQPSPSIPGRKTCTGTNSVSP